MMKKVVTLMKMNSKIDVHNDIFEIKQEVSDAFNKAYNQVFIESLQQYLGRVPNETDNISISINNVNRDEDIFLDNVYIGTIKIKTGIEGDDFIKNKVSLVVTFTPNIKQP